MGKNKSSPRYWVEKNGTIYARLQYKNDLGKTKEKYRPITDKRTARSVVEDMRKELETFGAETLESDKITFSELSERYLKAKVIPPVHVDGKKVAGLSAYKSVKGYVKNLEEYFGIKKIRLIKVSDVENFKNKRLATPVVIIKNHKIKNTDKDRGRRRFKIVKREHTRQRKLASVNRELETLRTMLNFAIENDWLINNPFKKKKGIISKVAEIERDRVLSFTEEQRLLAACTNKRIHLRPIIICALDTALRRGEMFKMRWQEVNFATGEIFIPQTNTKTEVERSVGMTERLRRELQTLWKVSPQDKTDLVFGIKSTIKFAWKSACKKAEIVDFRLHDCRHTATTRMIASGSPHTEVMKITGHTQLKTFLRYLNITTDTTQSCAIRLNNYLGQRERPSKFENNFVN